MGKIAVCRSFFLGSQDSESGCGAGSYHISNCKNKAVHRKNKVQCSNTIGTCGFGNKESISQNISRYAQHTENILRNITDK